MNTAFQDFYRNKRVLLTGHTGFKGAWLSEWLLMLGAQVAGFSLPPPTKPALFDQMKLADRLDHRLGDVRNRDAVNALVRDIQPDVVFHLAAQPLVRYSYLEPVETYATNVMGTVNLLDALRQMEKPCASVMITTDKCYENKEWLYGYRENDPMGGYDPYSSSKACAELAIQAFRRSFFTSKRAGPNIGLASARSGNVIGGGDWAQDRIVPDCIRSLTIKAPIVVRNPHATRPWQHVLEPLSGYLLLGQKLYGAIARGERGDTFASAFNFGPSVASNKSVKELVEELFIHWPGTWTDQSNLDAPHEAGVLNLSIEKAWQALGWQPAWSFGETIKNTVTWYRETGRSGADAREQTLRQIKEYTATAHWLTR